MEFAVNLMTHNGAEFISRAILSVANHAHFILVYDTGSTDDTIHIVKDLMRYYPHLKLVKKNVQHLGGTWTGSEKDIVLTALLNEMKENTPYEWILKVDDDEFYPESLMEEIKGLQPIFPVYSIPFIHAGGSGNKFLIKRLFQNIPGVRWDGIYGTETLALNGKRLNSKKCPALKHHFAHLGGLRKVKVRNHNYDALQ